MVTLIQAKSNDQSRLQDMTATIDNLTQQFEELKLIITAQVTNSTTKINIGKKETGCGHSCVHVYP